MNTIHEAGPLIGGVQKCIHCGFVLTDYRNVMVPEEDIDKPLRGWHEGAYVEISIGNPKFMGITNEPPTCRNYEH